MPVEKKFDKTISFDPKRCTKVYERLVDVFQEERPTVGETIIALGNLMYSLGASIGGYKDKGPGHEELSKMYYEKNPPTVDVALMLQGLQTTTWYDTYQELMLQESEDE